MCYLVATVGMTTGYGRNIVGAIPLNYVRDNGNSFFLKMNSLNPTRWMCWHLKEPKEFGYFFIDMILLAKSIRLNKVLCLSVNE